MDGNYSKMYVYSEIYSILNWLGDDYKKKVPRNLLDLFRLERKFNYTPNIDFSRPLNDQVRQETKNIIAYLQYTCWLEDDAEKAELKARVEENARIVKEQRRQKRMQERMNAANRDQNSLNMAIDDAVNQLNNGNNN